VRLRVLEAADTVAHKLRVPGRAWLCDRLDLAYGLTPEEIRRRQDAVEFYRDPANCEPAGPGYRRKGQAS
jgi:hypothetical protein